MKAILLASACAASIACGSAPAHAQVSSSADTAARKPNPNTVEELIVTATRREEKLQDVPLSITAYSQESLTAKGIVGYETLARETPGVTLNKQTANFNNFTARGIATNTYGANLQSTVAIYIDELPISTIGNTTTLDPSLYDVERVEFLRGPQGTLFGSGSLAGALRILTKSPDLKSFDASLLVDEGVVGSSSWRQRYNGMVNIPLAQDTAALRVVGFYRREEGWIDNVGTGLKHSNTLVDWGGRATFLWKPTDRLSIKLLASHEESNPEDATLQSPSLGRDKRISDRPDLYNGIITNLNATVDYHFNGANFTSSSTYSHFDQKFFVDLAGTFGGGIPFALDAYGFAKTFVEEARLASDNPGSKIDWVVGGFYLDRRQSTPLFFRSLPNYLTAHGMTGLPDEYYEREFTHSRAHELAGFGEASYHFNDQVWVTAGLRYGSVDAQGFVDGGYNSNYLVNAIFGVRGPLTVTTIAKATGSKVTATRPSYKLSVSYKPAPTLTTYATVSTGFRTPVVNSQAGTRSVVNPNDLVIPAGASSDDLTNYEVGAKGLWFDGRLAANLAAYYIDWRNIQIQANRTSDSIQFATNIGAARSEGLEFEIQARPAAGLTLALNGSLNDAKVTSLSASEAAISGAAVGARLAFPRVQGSASAAYKFDLAGHEANLSGVVQHVGSFPNAFPFVPGSPGKPNAIFGKTDSYTVVNGTFAVAFDRMTVGAYVENLLNDRSINYVHPEAFVASRYGLVPPRTIGVRLDYHY